MTKGNLLVLLTVTVTRKWQEADGIFGFLLAAVDGGPLPCFEPGAHIDIEIAPNLVRQFSLCSSSLQREVYEIAVLRDPASRGGSVALIDNVRVGDLLRISAPKNNFPLESSASHSILIAGGIGITPLLSMADWLHRNDRSFELHFAARFRQQMAFHRRLTEAFADHDIRLYLPDEPHRRRLDIGTVIGSPATGTHLYVCGPARLMDAVFETADEKGWPSTHLHREYFAATTEYEVGSADAFDVKIASTGKVLHVPADRAISAVLMENGIYVAMACEEGVCGNCLTGVLDGVPEHRDLYLTPEQQAANDCLAVCCSRSRSNLLVLDL